VDGQIAVSVASVLASSSESVPSVAATPTTARAVGERFLVAVDLVTAGDDAGDDGFVVVPNAGDGVLPGFSLNRLPRAQGSDAMSGAAAHPAAAARLRGRVV
jgi:hypothetical protein